MRFAFTDQQHELAAAVSNLLAKECSTEIVRQAWTRSTGRAPGAWAALGEMGVLGAMAPEADGGLGLSEVDTVLLLEACGRFALTEPIVDTMFVAAPEGWVEGLASACVVSPESPLGTWADSAEVIVALAADGVRVVPAAEVTLRPRRSVDGARHLFEIELPNVDPVAPVSVAARAFRRGTLGTAAQLLGLTDRMIAMTVDYVSEREQFGVKIGTFQAVKHHLANARTHLEFARPLVYRAAASLAANDPSALTHACMAKVQANEAAAVASRVALQCHGAIGYTTEFDLHLFMKRAWALKRSYGDTTWHRRAIARSII